MARLFCLCISIYIFIVEAFIPHPAIRLGGQAGESITHVEMTQIGFTRSLARFFADTQISSESGNIAEKFKKQHTIDDLYKLVHPNWTDEQIKLYSYPLKRVIDIIQLRNAVVDLLSATKNLPSAHFDSESFKESNARIMNLRKKVITDVTDLKKDLDEARGRIGSLLHTLQDFYSHSNWVEMGKTEINYMIGIQEDIGQIAEANQATCTSDGCKKMNSKCNIIQQLILKSCPMAYYDCRNNILPDINKQGLLTSGYMSNQFNANNEPIIKPTNVEKCSHGSVMDKTSHQVAIGGINKDTMTPIYSPHYHLHFDAANLSIVATEQFFNDLRKDIGDSNFDRLFAINPTEEEIQKAAIAIAAREKFHFFTSTLSVGLSSSDLDFTKTLKQRIQKILSIVLNLKDSDAPTYDLSDKGLDKSDVNIHSGSLLIDDSKVLKRRRLGRYRTWNTKHKI